MIWHCKITFVISYSPSSHWTPVNPGGQMQRKTLIKYKQVPPFKHGSLLQRFIAVDDRLIVFNDFENVQFRVLTSNWSDVYSQIEKKTKLRDFTIWQFTCHLIFRSEWKVVAVKCPINVNFMAKTQLERVYSIG